MVAVTLLVMTAAFGLNFGAGVFLAPLTAERGWGVGVLSAAANAEHACRGAHDTGLSVSSSTESAPVAS
jgi:hypothetical protein